MLPGPHLFLPCSHLYEDEIGFGCLCLQGPLDFSENIDGLGETPLPALPVHGSGVAQGRQAGSPSAPSKVSDDTGEPSGSVSVTVLGPHLPVMSL